MNVSELIEQLERVAEENPDAEVQVGHQPSWPIREVVGAVVHSSELPEEEPDGSVEADEEDGEDVVWIVANGHPYSGSPYAPKALWEVF